MSKDELWEALCERYPDFRDDEHIVKQRARGLRRLLEQAWDEGRESGFADVEKQDGATDLFKSIFGK